jgi:BirA family transcriptional regulator, biotin operon repressor / biotin---[acetyl-CoA-carboxylase] ligase
MLESGLMKENILELLKINNQSFLSGEKISKELGVSRASVWKYINLLKRDGYCFESSSRKGYRLISTPDILTSEEISNKLKTDFIGKKLIHFDTIDSTNLKAKEMAALGEEDGTIIFSEEQTAGRGRLGRQWVSPKNKGIWMSIILRPDINPMFASRITLIAAAAVYKATLQVGVQTLIKWPNDIVLNNKKVCGILTEMSAELNKIHYLVIGIGVNVNIANEDLPDELKSSATSLRIESGRIIDRKVLSANILNNFELLYKEFLQSYSIKTSVEICRNNSVLIGKEVRIINGNSEIRAKAIDINDEGELLIEHESGKIEVVFSGEVSMRGLYGYV